MSIIAFIEITIILEIITSKQIPSHRFLECITGKIASDLCVFLNASRYYNNNNFARFNDRLLREIRQRYNIIIM